MKIIFRKVLSAFHCVRAFPRTWFGTYVGNYLITFIPVWWIRKAFLLWQGAKLGQRTFINMRQYVLAPQRFVIGEGSHVNQGCFIDARGGVRIGSGVSVSHYVKIVTGTHDIMSRKFDGAFRPVKIGNHVWIGIGATILPGVTIGDGAVVAAGSVVVHDVDRYCVVGGVPARKIKSRTDVLEYECESAIKWL